AYVRIDVTGGRGRCDRVAVAVGRDRDIRTAHVDRERAVQPRARGVERVRVQRPRGVPGAAERDRVRRVVHIAAAVIEVDLRDRPVANDVHRERYDRRVDVAEDRALAGHRRGDRELARAARRADHTGRDQAAGPAPDAEAGRVGEL